MEIRTAPLTKPIGSPEARGTALRYTETLLRMSLEETPGGTMLGEAFLEARARRAGQQFQEHVFVAQLCIEDQIIELRDRVAGFDQLAEERVQDREAQALAWRYATQAADEPLDERREMLAHARASLIDVRITVAEHARVQRRLHALETADVLVLYALSRAYGKAFAGQQYATEDQMRAAFLASRNSREALESAGCIRASTGPEGEERVSVTNLGELVIRVLTGFVRNRSLPFEIPGHEHAEGGRTVEQAQAKIDAVLPLRTLLAQLLKAHPGVLARFSGSHWWPARVRDAATGMPILLPPRPHGLTRIEVHKVPRVEVDRLVACSPRRSPLPEFGQPFDGLVVEPLKAEGTDEWSVRISGPHDVLRVLADDLDIRWGM